MNDLEYKWEQSQLLGWMNDKSSKDMFKRFNINFENKFNEIIKLEYEKQQKIFLLISKIKKCIAICDFLDLQRKKKKWDVDKVKIFHLVSHAAIIGKLNNPTLDKTLEIFFAPVQNKINVNIYPSLDRKKDKSFTGVEILLKIRHEYVHEGTSIGGFFSTNGDLVFSCFYKNKKKNFSCCKLTYEKFLNIFFEAFEIHLDEYIKN